MRAPAAFVAEFTYSDGETCRPAASFLVVRLPGDPRGLRVRVDNRRFEFTPRGGYIRVTPLTPRPR